MTVGLDRVAEESRVVLETDSRLSDSVLWKLQRDFFDERGVGAWSRGTVPHYVTSNPFIAGAYAKVVFAFLRDHAAATGGAAPAGPTARATPPNSSGPSGPAGQGAPDQPIYIVELGAGSGRFAYHFLRRFVAKMQRSVLRGLPFRYVLTDFTEQNVQAFLAHEKLKPFFDQGVLDVARYDAGNDRQLTLRRSGETLAPGKLEKPLVVLANYVFDGIPMDLFHVDGGALQEGLVSVSTVQPIPESGRPDFGHLALTFKRRPAAADFYGDPALDGILAEYARRLGNTSVLFPAASLRAIAHLAELGDDRLLLLTGDKGYHREEDLLHRGEPELVVHGSFSLSVNYHAVGQWFRQRGGQAMNLSHGHAHLDICAFTLGGGPQGYVETRHAFEEAIDEQGPDDFYSIKRGVEGHYDTMSIEQMVSLVRMSGWDARLTSELLPSLHKKLEGITPALTLELLVLTRKVWDHYFPIGEEYDLSFDLGVLLHALRLDDEAIELFRHSLRLHGADRNGWFNIALSQHRLRREAEALSSVNQALGIDPDFERARVLRIQIEAAMELTGEAPPPTT